MTDPLSRTPFGEIVPARDGACGRRDVAVAWGLIVACAAAFTCLSVVASVPDALAPSALAISNYVAALPIGEIAP
jgi:hypothetical protein